jgi:hypothetical protein
MTLRNASSNLLGWDFMKTKEKEVVCGGVDVSNDTLAVYFPDTGLEAKTDPIDTQLISKFACRQGTSYSDGLRSRAKTIGSSNQTFPVARANQSGEQSSKAVLG